MHQVNRKSSFSHNEDFYELMNKKIHGTQISYSFGTLVINKKVCRNLLNSSTLPAAARWNAITYVRNYIPINLMNKLYIFCFIGKVTWNSHTKINQFWPSMTKADVTPSPNELTPCQNQPCCACRYFFFFFNPLAVRWGFIGSLCLLSDATLTFPCSLWKY